MHWKFWEKNPSIKAVKLPSPKELPSRLGMYLVVDLKYDPDWVWTLKMVTVKRENQKDIFDFRIFDPVRTKAEGLYVKSSNSLDGYPDMIYFDGWYNKNSWEMTMNNHYDSVKMEQPA